MPHIAITMIPGRNHAEKAELAEKVQSFIAETLAIDKKFVSISIEDIEKEDWEASMNKIDSNTIFIK